MRVYGPYVSKRGKLKGRRSVMIVRDDGSRRGMLYSRFLMQQKLGRELSSDEHVDHIDEDFTNDDIDNLQILSPAENVRKSSLGRPSPLKGIEKGWTHGTMNGWQKKKCRCDACLSSMRAYQKERNRSRRRSTEGRGPYRRGREHGTKTMYNIGCRCDLCRKRIADLQKKRRNLGT